MTHPLTAQKMARALACRGTRFLLVTCPCVPGWGIGDDASLHVLRVAVESKVVPLYEVEDGERYRISRRDRLAGRVASAPTCAVIQSEPVIAGAR